jgi:hypothetical protein
MTALHWTRAATRTETWIAHGDDGWLFSVKRLEILTPIWRDICWSAAVKHPNGMEGAGFRSLDAAQQWCANYAYGLPKYLGLQ